MVTRDELISAAYLREQERLHAMPKGYGGRGDKWTAAVLQLAQRFQAQTILDYGCGQGALGKALAAHGVTIAEYDPARPGLEALPEPADLVVTTDVLEHIEPDKLAAVIEHLRSLTRIALFAVIATRPASKFLSDGSNAHLIIRDGAWWTRALTKRGFRSVEPVPKSPMKQPSREVVLVLQ